MLMIWARSSTVPVKALKSATLARLRFRVQIPTSPFYNRDLNMLKNLWFLAPFSNIRLLQGIPTSPFLFTKMDETAYKFPKNLFCRRVHIIIVGYNRESLQFHKIIFICQRMNMLENPIFHHQVGDIPDRSGGKITAWKSILNNTFSGFIDFHVDETIHKTQLKGKMLLGGWLGSRA